MKYTTKSGKELPPEVVEVIEQEQKLQPNIGKDDCVFGFSWSHARQKYDFWYKIYFNDDFTEFYKLYSKGDVDSYGNKITKGENG